MSIIFCVESLHATEMLYEQVKFKVLSDINGEISHHEQ